MQTRARELLAGAALGLLVGALIGLAASPVVAGFLGTLTAGLSAFFGLRSADSPDEHASSHASRASAERIIGFSLMCVIAIAGGVFVRTHQTLSPSLELEVAHWKQAGYPDAEARQFAAYRMLGVLPASVTAAPVSPTPASSVLFGGSASECRQLDPTSYANAAETLKAFHIAGDRWDAAARAVESLPPASQADSLKAIWSLACRGG